MQTRRVTQRRSSFGGAACLLVLFCTACSDPGSDSVVLTADLPLHLEDHLDVATIEGSEVPADLPEPMEWRFDDPQREWKPVGYAESQPVRLTRLDDALRVDITEANYYTSNSGQRVHDGYIYIDVSDLKRDDWGHVSVRARVPVGNGTRAPTMGVRFNLTDRSDLPRQAVDWPFRYDGDEAPLIADGSEHTYLLQVGRQEQGEDWDEAWTQLGLRFYTGSQPDRVPTSIEILSVTLIPKEAAYADADVGVVPTFSDNIQRQALYAHAPAQVSYRVTVPDAGRLDVGLGVVRGDRPVQFAITAQPLGSDAVTLLEETYADSARRAQRSVDLSRFAGETVNLVLTATSDRVGTVALWVAPTLSGSRNTRTPNVIVYVIDSAGADFMSVYGYPRRTTPYLEQLAAEGAVFEHAYSNSTSTFPSTRSFMTSLHDSVLGGEVAGVSLNKR